MDLLDNAHWAIKWRYQIGSRVLKIGGESVVGNVNLEIIRTQAVLKRPGSDKISQRMSLFGKLRGPRSDRLGTSTIKDWQRKRRQWQRMKRNSYWSCREIRVGLQTPRESSGLKRRERWVASAAAGEASEIKTNSCSVYLQCRNHEWPRQDLFQGNGRGGC